MENGVETRRIVEKILSTHTATREELEYVYRALCKNTHPDLTGKDGSEFIRLQQVFRYVREAGASSHDPNPARVARETGYAGPLTPRAGLFSCLERYVQLGLHSPRVRMRVLLKPYSLRVLHAVEYWGGMYDPAFPIVFSRFNARRFERLATRADVKNYLYGRRLFADGLRWFLEYQGFGRESCRDIARERLRRSVGVYRFARMADNPVIPFAEWLLRELEKPAWRSRVVVARPA